MELCFLKSHALDTLKNGLPQTFDKYFTQRNNSWISEVCGENPFVKLRDITDFELAPLDEKLTEGEIDLRNCKILYKHLNFLTPRQAADERLWAGLCHAPFYDYMRRRNKYDIKKLPADDKEKKSIINGINNQFFFNSNARMQLLTNTLARYWWTGHSFSDSELDNIGAVDLYSKIFSIMTRAFAANPNILRGVAKCFAHFKDVSLNTDKHIRPALKELNKVGGAVVLDCLTEEEIATIMIEHVKKFFARRNVINTPPPQSYDTDKIIPRAKVSNARTVNFNNLVTLVSLDGSRKSLYRLDNRLKKSHPDKFNELLGKSIGSTVTFKDGKFKITEIK